MVDPAKQKKDEFIMDTNNSSIVSKRSVEKLYCAGEPEYFRYFVNKFKRRSPLINRGYWLRMRAIEHTVQKFLEEPTGKRKLVINLGCGYDPLPWLFLGKQPALCEDAVFVDVDYPQLMQRKHQMIDKTKQLKELLPDLAKTGKEFGLMCHSSNYAAIGCDLRDLEFLHLVLQEHLQVDDCSVAVLFVAEVSVAYMTLEASQAVMEWSAKIPDARFCLLEQHLPDGRDHPFAQTMLKHFEKLRTPLHAIGTMAEMKGRFARAGWPADDVTIRPLWDLWSDDRFLSSEQRQSLDMIEPFDEWEEFALFASHYFLLVSRTAAAKTSLETLREVPRPRPAELLSIGEGLVATELPAPHSHRRFGAKIPGPNTSDVVGVNAGLGTKERLTTTDTYARNGSPSALEGPPLNNGLMCQTITPVGDTGNCLLVGGRTSPDKAGAECWYRKDDVWIRAASLPEGRYRHSAVSVRSSQDGDGVLICGGRTGNGRILLEPLLWTEEKGWYSVKTALGPETVSQPPQPRFGATMTVAKDEAGCVSGLLIGGMQKDGTVVEDAWNFKLDGQSTLTWIKKRTSTANREGDLPATAFRFGAQNHRLAGPDGRPQDAIVGGVVARGMLTRDTEILTLRGSSVCRHPLVGPRPLLVGHSAHGNLVLGGGATCFSFGTYWSNSCEMRLQSEALKTSAWRLLVDKDDGSKQEPSLPPQLAPNSHAAAEAPSTTVIPRIQIASPQDFEAILAASKPVVLTGCDIGSCTEKWTPDYLKSTIGHDRQIAVHVSQSPAMDFQSKNFHYATQSFSTFLNAATSGSHLYLRALSASNPSQQPTNLAEDFPEIADDFALPDSLRYVNEHAHSSPLRISGPVKMWLHYDVLANVLCQIRGEKDLLLYPPSDVTHLSFPPGASSSSIDPFTATPSTHPELIHTHPHSAHLAPGEMLFIPPLWLHAASPTTGLSVAVNVFFRNLEKGYAAGRDVYGNRDLAAYEKGRRDLEKIVAAFRGVPGGMRRFYLERLGRELGEIARR